MNVSTLVNSNTTRWNSTLKKLNRYKRVEKAFNICFKVYFQNKLIVLIVRNEQKKLNVKKVNFKLSSEESSKL